VNPYAEGSAICLFGRTQLLCTASVEPGAPPFLEGAGQGWVTAEYAMLPRSTHTRTGRDHQRGGRAQEISRLIGRSLRAATDLPGLEGYTIRVDCDVMVADGGTRTAAISGGYVALALALRGLGLKPARQLCALSVGKLDGHLVVDLSYDEDSRAQVDLNLVMAPAGELVEVQGTAEDGLFSRQELMQMVDMALTASQAVFAAQNQALQGQ
jgi:ribonuclease PH